MTSTEDSATNNNSTPNGATSDQQAEQHKEPEYDGTELDADENVESVVQFSSFEELIARIRENKEAGNAMFKKNSYEDAIPFYNKVLEVWFNLKENKYTNISATKEQFHQAEELVRDTFNNAALVMLEMRNVGEAFRCAQNAYRVLQNTKSVYIMAKCFYFYKEFQRAKTYLAIVLKEQPENKEAQALMEKCDEEEEEYEPPSMFMYNNSFRNREEDELERAIALSKAAYEEEEKKRKEEEAEDLKRKQKADAEQEEILRNFQIEQQKKQLEKLKEEEEEHQDDDYEVEIDDDDVHVHHDENEDEIDDDISLTQSEIEEQMRLLELEEQKADFIENDDVD
ncbi:peptidyl-prolyl cis-trans isomerase [Naegleria gruberi]|uniref:Peptidyl-prolyl cis-trans isomerase n=1 Tax=Naegleria gruberi TaxID=5762 RepID=D2V125_NAEGR|nr:peptidyl-prolyl cis-trans isomerase [Naegleria gruberi]EFC49830.1 peptidyl-prolyl cis-trans isomerase [Naegleria gruberi]|eukprot:XP_002682574.1 peptidyl-prolyl cis-trans isomerase [Naegleria gruberi strain NEG-M]